MSQDKLSHKPKTGVKLSSGRGLDQGSCGPESDVGRSWHLQWDGWGHIACPSWPVPVLSPGSSGAAASSVMTKVSEANMEINHHLRLSFLKEDKTKTHCRLEDQIPENSRQRSRSQDVALL